MSDRFQPLPFEQLCAWISGELEQTGAILGLPRQVAFVPSPSDRFTTSVWGHRLETPFGVAAGPHSQLAPNIVAAWLCGARLVELKTVQTLDHIAVHKPCIYMQDEGYNVEWSQELTVEQSFDEYLGAWILVHALHQRLGFPGETPGVVFNMSVGYDLAGLQRPNMQWFLERMRGAGGVRERLLAVAARYFPDLPRSEVPGPITDNVTLSTMHGCPPQEIGKIASYLMSEWGLHAAVKLNPTLLGPETVREILNQTLGWRHVEVPDAAFAHDIHWAEAIDLLRELQTTAARLGVVFGVKLSNTLEVSNQGTAFDPRDRVMYLSGRPLHALTVELARRLDEALGSELPMSFSAGADAHNAHHLLAAGLTTVTSCSDLLRPGGYTRLLQYLENTARSMEEAGAADIPEYIRRSAADRPGYREALGMEEPARTRACARLNLAAYAASTRRDPALHRDTFDRSRTKTVRPLGAFDCIAAPCVDDCPVHQKVPQYMRLVEAGRLDEAVAITLEDNPLPTILGRACPHQCEAPCVRTHYDHPLAIRELKRFIMDHGRRPLRQPARSTSSATVAVVGAGPCGLAVATFLGRAGYPVTVFDEQPRSGGMVTATIPSYRAAGEAVARDLEAVAALGAELRTDHVVGRDVAFADLRRRFRYVVIAVGAQRGVALGIDGQESEGVLDGLALLRAVGRGQRPVLGQRVGVVGGGDVAVDCARSARRLGSPEVAILYRRTVREMPAHAEEIAALREEGVAITELVAPRRVVASQGRMTGLECMTMRLGEPDASGRPRPEPVPGTEHVVALDTLVVAIGQRPDLGFLGDELPERTPAGFLRIDPTSGETSLAGVFAGGDIVEPGPRTIVAACADGRRIADAIQRREEGERAPRTAPQPLPDTLDLLLRRARRAPRVAVPALEPARRHGFDEIVRTLSPAEAAAEASRCLSCDLMCSTCVTVCPNRAMFSYQTSPFATVLPVLEVLEGRVVVRAGSPFSVDQQPQVAVLADLCNECGNCTTFCPTSGRPFDDKPRLYLTLSELEAQEDNAYLVTRDAGVWTVAGRFGGTTHRLVLDAGIHYSRAGLEVDLARDTFQVLEARLTAPAEAGRRLDLSPCFTMYVILQGLSRSAPWLPAARVPGAR